MQKIEVLNNGNVKITIPIVLKMRGSRKRVELSDKPIEESTEPLVVHLARAFRWQELIDSGRLANIDELAATVKFDRGYIGRTLRLTMLSPELVNAILNGTAPNGLNLSRLRGTIPSNWDDQKTWLESMKS